MASGRHLKKHLVVVATACVTALLASGAAAVRAQRLPVRCYDTGDGLAHNAVRVIYQDAKGYLWIGTWDGLNRFDGYRFITYSVQDGLGHPMINDIAEDRRGRLWVATNGGGVARLIEEEEGSSHSARSLSISRADSHRQKFVRYHIDETNPHANAVNKLLFDAQDRLWCLTDAGIYRAEMKVTALVKFTQVLNRRPQELPLHVALVDHRGRLWLSSPEGLARGEKDRLTGYWKPNTRDIEGVVSLVADQRGNVIAAHSYGLIQFPAREESRATEERTGGSQPSWAQPEISLSRAAGHRLPLVLERGQKIHTLKIDSTGTLWIGTTKGLIKYGNVRSQVYTMAQGLSHNDISALAQDREDNLWVGTNGGGVCQLLGERIVSFTQAEGLPDPYVWRVIEDHDGSIYASTSTGGVVEIRDEKVIPVPGSHMPPFPQILGRIQQDRRGDWWIGTHAGLFRFEGPRLRFRHGQKFAAELGFPDSNIAFEQGIYEDPRGRLWISTWTGQTGPDLYWFDPRPKGRPRFCRLSLRTTFPEQAVLKMASDRSGALWLAAHRGLGRLAHGQITVFGPIEGLPEIQPRALFSDSRGWLWIGWRRHGLSVTRDPTAARPTFVHYSTRDGLASDVVSCITEDDAGRIYVGTSRGLDRLDPRTGRIRHFSAQEGLAGDGIIDCMKDRRGNIWAATSSGLSRYDPRVERPRTSPPLVYLSRIQVVGQSLSLPERGLREMPKQTFSAPQNTLRLDYVGISFGGQRALRYQYKLEGVDTDWNAPTEEHSVSYARLAPGSYRFLVRAITREGIVSEPAVFPFAISPPFWQRGWFLALILMSVGALAYALHRYRVAQAVEIQRVRTRIAADLHDDVGAGLSEIALLCELIREQKVIVPSESPAMLARVAERARELVDAMSDIVWAIDPRRDNLKSVLLRIGDLASELLGPKGITCEIEIPSAPENVKLTPDERRHLYLIFKEALTNIVRHAECTLCRLRVRIRDHHLIAEISDDGRGFAVAQERPSRGHGLENMQRRAAELGGQLHVESAPDRGTRLTLNVPLR